MGNTESCKSIRPIINRACDIGKCTKNIKGHAANSSSPTDIWELEMYDGVRYGQEEIPNQIILKLYIDNLTPNLKTNIETIYKDMVQENKQVEDHKELKYESDIYNYVIGLFTRANINPYFVRYYGASQNCTFNQLVESVTTGKKIDLRDMTKLNITVEQFIENLMNNTLYMAVQKENRFSICNRTPIRDLKPHRQQIWEMLHPQGDSIKYGMIITEKSNGETYYDWFPKQLTTGGRLSDNGWKSILQVLTALTALETLEVAHNDLHQKNIFVETLNGGDVLEQFQYNYMNDNDIIAFGIRSNFRCAIYDWDRAYMEILGKNPLIESSHICEDFSQCNEYLPQREVTKFLIYILNYNIHRDDKEIIYRCMMGGNIQEFDQTMVRNNYFLQNIQVQPPKALQRYQYERYRIFTPTVVLTNLVSELFKKRQGIIETYNKANGVNTINTNSVIYDMRRGSVQYKFSRYYQLKDFKQMEIFEDDRKKKIDDMILRLRNLNFKRSLSN